MDLWSMLSAYLLDSPFLDDDDDQISNCGRLLTICKSPVCEVPTPHCAAPGSLPSMENSVLAHAR